MIGNFSRRLAVALFLFAVLVIAPVARAEAVSNIVATPATIDIGAQYDGTTLQVSGTIPSGSEVIVRFSGEPATLHLREKGKVFGMLWMNVGKVSLSRVPSVCLIDSSSDLARQGEGAMPYRLQGLRHTITVDEHTGSTGIDVIDELLLLKRQAGLYAENSGGVQLQPEGVGGRGFKTSLHIPSALPPGNYHVEAIALRDGAVVGKATAPVKASLAGFPLWLSQLAFKHSLLYGVLATLIAIASGLLIGFIFQSRGGAH